MKLRGLYAITDSQLLDDGRLLPYVEAALRGGARLLQYRDKSSDQARRLREAESLRELCERYGAQLIVNDDAELAARLGVGLHLGQTDGSLSAARALLGRQAIIGATCHAPESADALLPNMKTWKDNADTARWYYLDVQEATNSHTYLGAPTETWTSLTATPDWSQYE